MSEDDGNFLSRWSRHKTLVRQGVEPPAPPAPPAVVPPAAAAAVGAPTSGALPMAAAEATPAAAGEGSGQAAAAPAQPKLTLDDVEALTPESDFSRFVARDVDPQVKNSAMKKLFADPHYNVMDGLDTYIDDYNTPDPLPKAMLRQLVQARMLGLLDDEMPDQPAVDEVSAVAPPDAEPAAEGATAELPAPVEVAVEGLPPALPAAEALAEAPAPRSELDAADVPTRVS